MREPFERFGAKLGLTLSVVGFVLIFLGWNGAASTDRVASQFPYLISGGIGGLALVVLGATLILVDVRREDRERLESVLAEIKAAVERLAPPVEEEEVDTGRGPRVLTGQASYHRPGCRLLEGRGELPEMSLEKAESSGLLACRVCNPAAVPKAPARPPRRAGRRPAKRSTKRPRG